MLLGISVSSSAAAAESPPRTEEVERPVGESGCSLLPDRRIACSGEFLRTLASGYQDARADAAVCGVRLSECRAVAIPPPPAPVPPLDPLPAFGVGAASGAVLVAGVAVLLAGGPVEVGGTMTGAGIAGLISGVAILAW